MTAAPDVSLTQVLEQAREGASPEQLLLLLLSADEAEVVRRLATVRSFDRALGQELAGDVSRDPRQSVDRIAALGLAEQVPGTTDVLRVRENVRKQQLEGWFAEVPTGVPPDLIALSARLVEFYDDPARADPIEGLYHQLLADPKAAKRRFENLYEEADRAFDLARCRDLVDVFTERNAGVRGGIELGEEYRRYLDARGVWIDDWYRTTRFLQPAETVQPVDVLLGPDSSRVLQIWAPGGIGKTMLIRWVISRRCVPRPNPFACARIDLDTVDRRAVLQEPWLVVLEISWQLAPQLRDNPFDKVLTRYGSSRGRLFLRPVEGTASETLAPEEVIDLETRFAAGLADLDETEPVLIVLDTLENARVGDDPEREPARPLFQMLGRAHAGAPASHLVLSGRYDVASWIPDYESLFPDSRVLELTGFSEDEARAYLKTKRGVESPELVDAAVKFAARSDDKSARTLCSPIDLALLGDLIEVTSDLDPKKIETGMAGDVRRTYLIERIVERVDSHVQWVLLYGVVPRVLDLAFVQNVLAPWIESATSDKPTLAKPDLGDDAEEAWTTDLARVQPEELWTRLRSYAGPSSWVRIERDVGEILRFQPEVVEPMRRILWERPLDYARLQEDAAAYFESKAREKPQLWGRWMREAIFHRFQLEGPDAEPYWHDQIDAAVEQGRADRRAELAAEVWEPEYVVDGEPRPWKRRRIIRSATLLEAVYQRAIAEAQRGELGAAALHLDDVRRKQAGLARPAVSEARLAAVEAALRFADGDVEQGRARLDTALRARHPVADRVWLLTSAAGALAAHDADEGRALYRRALQFALAAPERAGWRTTRLFELGRGLEATDDLERALDACAAARSSRAGADESRLASLLGSLLLRVGNATEALAHASPEQTGTQGLLLSAEAHLALLQPTQALAACDRAIDASVKSDPAAAGRAHHLRGLANAQLLETDAALSDFLMAAELSDRIEDVAQVHLARAAFQLHDLGDVNEAYLSWEHASRTATTIHGHLAIDMLLFKSELELRAGIPAEARKSVEAAKVAVEAGGGAPRHRIRIALAGLALGDARSSGRFAAMLADNLALVRPAAARLPLLQPLNRCEELHGVPAGVLMRVRRLVPSATSARGPYARLDERDRARLALLDVELDRVLGRRRSATGKLRAIEAGLARTRDDVGLREWLASAERLGVELKVRPAPVGDGAGAPLAAATAILAGMVAAPAAAAIAASLVEAARPLLQRAGGGWRARLAEALAREASDQGDEEEAAKQRDLAAELYAQVGDRQARDRVLGKEGARPVVRAEPPERGALVTIERTAEGVSTTALAEDRELGPYHARKSALVHALLGKDRPFAGVVPAEVKELLVSAPDQFAVDLAGILRVDELRTGRRADLRLRLLDVHPLPWELARVPDVKDSTPIDALFHWIYRTSPRDERDTQDVRAIQVALAQHTGTSIPTDGMMDTQTETALAAFQRDVGLEPTGHPDPLTEQKLFEILCPTPSVTIVRPSREFEQRFSRGSKGAVPLERVYARHGFDVEVAEAIGPDELRKILAAHPTAIVHVAAGFVDASGSVALDFAAYGEPRSKAPFELGRVASPGLHQMLRGPVPKPILVLDAPIPRGPLETADQLFLRNVFASELLAFGTARAIIATGFVQPSRARELYEPLVAALGSGKPFGEVVATLRRSVRSRRAVPVGAPGFERAATALFARSAEARTIIAKPR